MKTNLTLDRDAAIAFVEVNVRDLRGASWTVARDLRDAGVRVHHEESPEIRGMYSATELGLRPWMLTVVGLGTLLFGPLRIDAGNRVTLDVHTERASEITLPDWIQLEEPSAPRFSIVLDAGASIVSVGHKSWKAALHTSSMAFTLRGEDHIAVILECARIGLGLVAETV